ncbi:MAG: hypothetical protein ACRC8A_10690 [Microcoleaceae cyanobacterium]
MPQLALLPGAVNEILAAASDTKLLTEADRYGLMAAILDGSLTEDDHRSINRLLRAVLRGHVQFEPRPSS